MSKEKSSAREPTSNITVTTLRIPDVFYNDVKNVADYVGDSVNGTMLHLIRLGMKIYDSKVTIHQKIE